MRLRLSSTTITLQFVVNFRVRLHENALPRYTVCHRFFLLLAILQITSCLISSKHQPHVLTPHFEN